MAEGWPHKGWMTTWTLAWPGGRCAQPKRALRSEGQPPRNWWGAHSTQMGTGMHHGKASRGKDIELDQRFLSLLGMPPQVIPDAAHLEHPTQGSCWSSLSLSSPRLDLDQDQITSGERPMRKSPSSASLSHICRRGGELTRGATLPKPFLPTPLVSGTHALESHEIVKRFYSNS